MCATVRAITTCQSLCFTSSSTSSTSSSIIYCSHACSTYCSDSYSNSCSDSCSDSWRDFCSDSYCNCRSVTCYDSCSHSRSRSHSCSSCSCGLLVLLTRSPNRISVCPRALGWPSSCVSFCLCVWFNWCGATIKHDECERLPLATNPHGSSLFVTGKFYALYERHQAHQPPLPRPPTQPPWRPHATQIGLLFNRPIHNTIDIYNCIITHYTMASFVLRNINWYCYILYGNLYEWLMHTMYKYIKHIYK